MRWPWQWFTRKITKKGLKVGDKLMPLQDNFQFQLIVAFQGLNLNLNDNMAFWQDFVPSMSSTTYMTIGEQMQFSDGIQVQLLGPASLGLSFGDAI